MADNDKHNTDSTLVLPEEKDITPSSTASGKDKAGAEPTSKHPSHAGLWIVIILTLLIAAGTAAAGYWFLWQKDSGQSALADEQSAQKAILGNLNDENAQLQRKLIELEKSKQALAGTVNSLTEKTESLQLQTEQLLSQLGEMEGRRPSDWLLAEADYLVRMAGRKVWLEQDTDTAVLLLENADQRLKELSDPSVIPVRGLIAQDIQTLRQVNRTDTVKLALTLSGFLSQVDALPLKTFTRPDENTGKEALSESVDDWKSNLAKVWHSIVDDFISVRRTDAPVAPMMTAEEMWLYKEQLKLQIMQAQSAAMSGEDNLYQQSVANAKALLNDKFDTDAPEINGALSTLDALGEANVQENLPEELSAMAPLQRLLESRVKAAYGKGEAAQ
ncbi:uroporphyrinogen-III C-methyltransferase [Alteromonas sp. RKMC-009]|uniref:uroporphyrinogen-III C-methyltransferase n=1 Tax=Alteromonas sp. RKMC-009 TaxID=2267264 RepID=UPI000E6A5A86|nr:uroporphyrinogen-III C-methyltransferase [Alteromonas sp. RKMC-009]AYA62867.1 heme biosynthesis operon protein HemX [Alteromonas sp. RKMC-009]